MALIFREAGNVTQILRQRYDPARKSSTQKLLGSVRNDEIEIPNAIMSILEDGDLDRAKEWNNKRQAEALKAADERHYRLAEDYILGISGAIDRMEGTMPESKEKAIQEAVKRLRQTIKNVKRRKTTSTQETAA